MGFRYHRHPEVTSETIDDSWLENRFRPVRTSKLHDDPAKQQWVVTEQIAREFHHIVGNGC